MTFAALFPRDPHVSALTAAEASPPVEAIRRSSFIGPPLQRERRRTPPVPLRVSTVTTRSPDPARPERGGGDRGGHLRVADDGHLGVVLHGGDPRPGNNYCGGISPNYLR